MATMALNSQANGSTAVASDLVEVSGDRFSTVATSEKRGLLSNVNTPHGTATDGVKPKVVATMHPNFGGATTVESKGGFPALGSTLGPYFSVGKLGKGTFCSIHKCINMHYNHDAVEGLPFSQKGKPKVRLAAAKVEIGEFKNSGVLGGEATMLQFLDASLDPLTVPVYMGHFRGEEDVSAIVMEYLPGQDMHWIRDWAAKYKSRRVSVEDAVYLTAEVMLPLLQRMHQVGIVHRDVKPSNCVKRGLKDFCMVDFGLSKSIVVPGDSSMADTKHEWKGKDWIRPPNHTGTLASYRKEREKADFRGTSMYASLRVHQLKDYCPRDDIWGLLYVFCDLVSGGLPWMSFAANRDRQACQKLKERIHGEGQEGAQDETRRLLYGSDYHMALFKKFRGKVDPPEGVTEEGDDMPEPLGISKDEEKVELLRKAFAHLGSLGFTDLPDYEYIKQLLEGFLKVLPIEDNSLKIDWKRLADATTSKSEARSFMGEDIPDWDFEDNDDPVDSSLFQDAVAISGGENVTSLTEEESDMARLPLELQYRITQMEYNWQNHTTIRPHLALRDWMKASLPILYGDWDSRRFERGGHRSSDDPYRREVYLNLLEKCLKCAEKFQNFRSIDCFYLDFAASPVTGDGRKKRRKVLSTSVEPSLDSIGSDLTSISGVFFRLRTEREKELNKARAPPPRLSFG